MQQKPRPSPTASATSFAVGTRKRGNDGRMYVVVQTARGVRRWQAVQQDGAERQQRRAAAAFRVARRVYIIDNGGTPFVVELSTAGDVGGPGVARVLRQKGGTYADDLDEVGDLRDPATHAAWLEPWRVFRYRRAFVGLDPQERRKEPSGFFGRLFGSSRSEWWRGGNSVLLEVATRSYVAVGSEIFAFRTPPGDDIVEYVSPMGNSGVPYPYAVGARNTYLTLELTYLANDLIRHLRETDASSDDADPYDLFYRTDMRTGAKVEHLPKANKLQAEHKRAHPLLGYRLLHPRL